MATIAESTTFILTSTLASLSLLFSLFLLRVFFRGKQGSVGLWSASLFLTSLVIGARAAQQGPDSLGSEYESILRAVIGFGTILASTALICAVCNGCMTGRPIIIILSAVLLKFMAYSFWMALTRNYEYVAFVYTFDTVLIILILSFFTKYRDRPFSGRTMMSQWLVVGAILADYSAVVFHPEFNHLDLYFSLQILSLFFLFRAGWIMKDYRFASRYDKLASALVP